MYWISPQNKLVWNLKHVIFQRELLISKFFVTCNHTQFTAFELNGLFDLIYTKLGWQPVDPTNLNFNLTSIVDYQITKDRFVESC